MKIKPINQLYHQFLKPKGIPQDLTPKLIEKLKTSNFINIIISSHSEPKYIENPKLLDELNKDELFKIIGDLK